MSLNTRGTMPGASFDPWMVYVLPAYFAHNSMSEMGDQEEIKETSLYFSLPEHVMPYAKSNPFWPSRTVLTRPKAAFVYTSSCVESSSKTCTHVGKTAHQAVSLLRWVAPELPSTVSKWHHQSNLRKSVFSPLISMFCSLTCLAICVND